MRRTGRLLLASTLVLAGPALADTAPKQEGDYGGVVPGEADNKPGGKPGKGKRAAKGTLSWIGFEAKDGGSQLFLQSVAPFEVVSQRVAGNTLIVTLSLTKLGTNTWRPIDTRYFDTPLSRVVAKRGKGKRIELRVDFKDPKDAREGALRTATEPDGMFYAYLSFGGGGGGGGGDTPAAGDDGDAPE